MEEVIAGWSTYFGLIVQLLEEAERHYGIANLQCARHIVEHFEVAIQTCSNLKNVIDYHHIFQAYSESLTELLVCLRSILGKWVHYQEQVETNDNFTEYAHQVSTSHSGDRGRPRFNISKEQLEYLFSLSFTTLEVASLLGVSRTTI